MSASDPKSLSAIGFLTVLEHAEQGLFGGYLVLNATGRPLEFHCTAPVRPNRAQEILYGPTLAPFLYGEQIGQTLLAKAKTEPLLVCTDVEPALAVRDFVALPVVLIAHSNPIAAVPNAADNSQTCWQMDAAHGQVPPPTSRLLRFTLGMHQVAVAATHEDDQQQVVSRWQPYAENFDLCEPFTRIREAIEEAQRSSR
jgi:hypothetical protein